VARLLVYWPKQPPLAHDSISPFQHLNPSVPHSNRVPSTHLTAHLLFVSQNRALVARFLVYWPKQPPLAHDSIAPFQHLNPSVPRSNRVPFTHITAQPHFVSQNRAPVARFLFYFILLLSKYEQHKPSHGISPSFIYYVVILCCSNNSNNSNNSNFTN
jgi:hypothetical protein